MNIYSTQHFKRQKNAKHEETQLHEASIPSRAHAQHQPSLRSRCVSIQRGRTRQEPDCRKSEGCKTTCKNPQYERKEPGWTDDSSRARSPEASDPRLCMTAASTILRSYLSATRWNAPSLNSTETMVYCCVPWYCSSEVPVEAINPGTSYSPYF